MSTAWTLNPLSALYYCLSSCTGKAAPVYNHYSWTAQPLLNGTGLHNAQLVTILNPQQSCNLRILMQKHLPDLCYPSKNFSNLSRSSKTCLFKTRASPQHKLAAGTRPSKRQTVMVVQPQVSEQTSVSTSYLPVARVLRHMVSRLQHRHPKCIFSTVPWAAHHQPFT